MPGENSPVGRSSVGLRGAIMSSVISLLPAIAILAAINSVQAQDRNATQGQAQQSEPSREGRHNVSGEKLREPGTTDAGHENDGSITRPWTRDDVVRDILRTRRGTEGLGNPTSDLGPQ